jgi:hypothetical protein
MLQKGQAAVFGAKATSKELGAGAIAGIVIGSILGVALLAGILLLCCWCGKKKKTPMDDAKAAAVTKAKAHLAKTGGSNGGGKKTSHGSSPPHALQAAAPVAQSPPVHKPSKLLDCFSSWDAPQEATRGPSTSTGGLLLPLPLLMLPLLLVWW